MNLARNRYVTLARRELWEHRVLWLAPVVLCALIVALPLLVGKADTILVGTPPEAGGEFGAQILGRALTGVLMLTLGGIVLLPIFVYLLDCLYGERKDRSILFWKSLPVSDAETVLAKLGVAVVLVPLLVVLLATLAQPLVLAGFHLRVGGVGDLPVMPSLWGGLKVVPQYLLGWLYAVLWYSPVTALLLLASVLAKRAPMMYALLPPLAVFLVEGVFLQDVVGGRPVSRFILEWMLPWTRADWAWIPDEIGGMILGVGSPDWLVLFTNPALWAGLAVAAGMVYIVIRLRRYRDDT